MKRGGFRPGSGPAKGAKKSPAETAIQELKTPDLSQKRYKTALEWCMDKINDPNAPDDLKYRIAAVTMPFQSPRVEGRLGKKDLKAAEAKKPEQVFAPAPAPALLKVA